MYGNLVNITKVKQKLDGNEKQETKIEICIKWPQPNKSNLILQEDAVKRMIIILKNKL